MMPSRTIAIMMRTSLTPTQMPQYQQKNEPRNKNKKLNLPTKIYSVLEAKRIHQGFIKVIGKIVTKTEMYVVDTQQDGKWVFRDARFIQLEDIEKLVENERLDVYYMMI